MYIFIYIFMYISEGITTPNRSSKEEIKMEENNMKLVYIKVPKRLYVDMQRYGVMDDELSPWFIGEMMMKIEGRKEKENGKQLNR